MENSSNVKKAKKAKQRTTDTDAENQGRANNAAYCYFFRVKSPSVDASLL